ncbi:MAG: acetyl-CoA hydrolase/transferase C-terminal domain-containing protein [Promethearchaeota archaeon]
MGSIQKVLTKEDFDKLQYFGILKEELSYTDYALVNGTKKYSIDFRDKENLILMQEECIGKELKNGYIVGATFFLGSSDFYNHLINMEEEERKLIRMNSVLKINRLYGEEKLRRIQRVESRFYNTGMYVTLMGAVASYQLEDGRIISGIGGQFNFVNMAQELEDGRSIICCKSTRGSGKKTKSNILFSYGHTSIPRYLKDIVITEYGIADLRGTTDEESIKAMLNITDSRFQESLLAEAKKANKIDKNYKIPEKFKNNTPEALLTKFNPYFETGLFKTFPFGHDFTEDEFSIAVALKTVKEHAEKHKLNIIKTILKSPSPETLQKAKHYLELMELDNPQNFKFKVSQRLLCKGLELTGKI